MEDKKKKLQDIEIENFIWLIYYIIITLSYFSNVIEKDYLINNNQKGKDLYHTLNLFIFFTLVIIYLYFYLKNYQDFKNLKTTDSKKKKELTLLSLLGTLLALISGIIFLYVIIFNNDNEVEIAFN